MNGPLAGVKVVELATFIAAPAGTHLLASQGASVVKVEDLTVTLAPDASWAPAACRSSASRTEPRRPMPPSSSANANERLDGDIKESL